MSRKHLKVAAVLAVGALTLSACTSTFLPCPFLKRACMRRAWKDAQFEQLEMSRYVFCAGSHTSRS